MTPKIYHNPACGTSRNVLGVLEAAGYRPDIIDYLSAGWTREGLIALFAAAGVSAREALRETKSPAQELGLLEEDVSEDMLLAAMVEHPVLVNRPFVVTEKGTSLCRPSERVLDLIEHWPQGPFYKEDGSLMIDENGKTV